MKEKKKLEILKAAMIPSFIAILLLIGLGVVRVDLFGAFLEACLFGLADNFGWLACGICLFAVAAAIYIVFSKIGDIKIGGEDARPEIKTRNWYIMSLCGGIGTGILFWAMAEPIYHWMSPPTMLGIEAGSNQAAVFGIGQAMCDWTIVQYCLYGVTGVGFALASYNMGKSLSYGSVLEGMGLNKAHAGKLRTVIHALFIFCMTCSIGNTCSAGILQIGAGLRTVFGINESAFVYLIIAIIVGAGLTITCVIGLKKGLKFTSNETVITWIALMIIVLIFGSATFMGQIGIEGLGDFLNNFIRDCTITNSMNPKDTWDEAWLLQTWFALICTASLLGMYFARMAKGRTVREFVLVNVLFPSAFCVVWISIWGGMAIDMQASGKYDIWAAVSEHGMQTTIFELITSLPAGKIIACIFMVSLCLSMCNFPNTMASTLATLCAKNLSINDEPPRVLKVFFGICMTTVAYLLIISKGVDSIRGLFVLIGMLTSWITLTMLIAPFIISRKLKKENNYLLITEKIEQ